MFRELLQLAFGEILHPILGVGEDEIDRMILRQVVIDHPRAPAFPPARQRAPNFSQTASTGDHRTRPWIEHEREFQFKDILRGQEVAGRAFKNGKMDEFHGTGDTPLADIFKLNSRKNIGRPEKRRLPWFGPCSFFASFEPASRPIRFGCGSSASAANPPFGGLISRRPARHV